MATLELTIGDYVMYRRKEYRIVATCGDPRKVWLAYTHHGLINNGNWSPDVQLANISDIQPPMQINIKPNATFL